ncbi:hypothetical protein FV226_08095 [Methylobacterium sp. WL12]|uniref:hypothetical protein n=1 Tax=Methylobacterium sp. WL12 TaxID=2603890 RepID=UPI0011C9DBF6|nr:hypothetical protein [Methylobacterium sp. WL12]TXM73766.1 hypothetical protein FV226_08095 [Methylobacterium sp. WL12]
MLDAVTTPRRTRSRQPIAAVREGARTRKARQRAREAEAGRPDAGAIDRALGDALRVMLNSTSESLSRPITLRALLEETRRQLRARQRRRVKAGKAGITYDPALVVEAMKARLKIPA